MNQAVIQVGPLGLEKVGGLSLLTRIVYYFQEAGISDFLLEGVEAQKIPALQKEIRLTRKPLRNITLAPKANNENKSMGHFFFDGGTFVTPGAFRKAIKILLENPNQASYALDPSSKLVFLAYAPAIANVAPTSAAPTIHNVHIDPLTDVLCKVESTQDIAPIEDRMRRSLFKATDGWVDTHINRPISTRLSVPLARWNADPNTLTTIVFLMSIWATWLVAGGSYWGLLWGGIIFQAAGILDCCDGEVSRLSLKSTTFGQWYDTITDNIRYGFIFVGLAIASYKASGWHIYLWGALAFCFLLLYLVSTNVDFILKNGLGGTHLVVTAEVEKTQKESKSLWARWVLPLKGLAKQDSSALVILVLCALGLPAIMFWAGFVGLFMMCVAVTKAIGGTQSATTDEQRATEEGRNPASYIIFLALGTVIFASLFYRTPLAEFEQGLSALGSSIYWILPIAPIWFVVNALSTMWLTHFNVPLKNILYNQIVGDSLNNLVPLAGVAGEPFRIKHFTNWMSLEKATLAVVYDRLTHIVTSLAFSAFSLFLAIELLPQSFVYRKLGFITALAFAALAFVLAKVAISPYPSKLTSYALKKFNLEKAISTPEERLSRRIFLSAFAWKFLANILSWLEIYAILRLLNLDVGLAAVVGVGALIAATSALFFMIPQGLGVNEAGIAAVFAALQLPMLAGLSIGVLRRLRIFFWSIIGVSIFAFRWYRRYTRQQATKG